MNFKLHKSESGFTLIELMATLAILALIVVIAVPSIGTLIANADEKAEAASIALTENAGSLADIDDLEHDRPRQYNVTTLIDKGYLDLDRSSEIAAGGSYVTLIGNGNKYVYMGEYGQEELPEMPEDPEDIEEEVESPSTPMEHDKPPRPENPGDGEYTYQLIEGSETDVEITGHTNRASIPDHMDIPGEIDGYNVVAIGAGAFDWSAGPTYSTEITIPEGVTSIGAFAFLNRHDWPQQFEKVNLPESLESIGMHAFLHSNLSTVDIPSNVSYIESYAFYRLPAWSGLGSYARVGLRAEDGTYAAEYAKNTNSVYYVSP